MAIITSTEIGVDSIICNTMDPIYLVTMIKQQLVVGVIVSSNLKIITPMKLLSDWMANPTIFMLTVNAASSLRTHTNIWPTL